MAFSIHSIYRILFKRWRQRRFQTFLETIKPTLQDSILDVGGTRAFWNGTPKVAALIHIVNIKGNESLPSTESDQKFLFTEANGCNLPFPDKSFHIIISNSVIEHLSTTENQQLFAAEAQRVGDALWIQTPAFECPIEPHYLAPFIHWMPSTLQTKLLRWITPWGWIQKPNPMEVKNMVAETRLLRKSEFQSLFPDCLILEEKLWGIFPKSYIAVRLRSLPYPS